MPRFNESDVQNKKQGITEPGTYFSEVFHAKESKSKSGYEMINVGFKTVDTGRVICFDNLTFGGDALGIAATKVKAMGLTKDDASNYSFDAGELIGLQVNLTVISDVYNGILQLKPDFNADGFGYSPVEKQTGGVPF